MPQDLPKLPGACPCLHQLFSTLDFSGLAAILATALHLLLLVFGRLPGRNSCVCFVCP